MTKVFIKAGERRVGLIAARDVRMLHVVLPSGGVPMAHHICQYGISRQSIKCRIGIYHLAVLRDVLYLFHLLPGDDRDESWAGR